MLLTVCCGLNVKKKRKKNKIEQPVKGALVPKNMFVSLTVINVRV